MEIDIFITILLFVFTLVYPKSKKISCCFFLFLCGYYGDLIPLMVIILHTKIPFYLLILVVLLSLVISY